MGICDDEDAGNDGGRGPDDDDDDSGGKYGGFESSSSGSTGAEAGISLCIAGGDEGPGSPERSDAPGG